jgi:hypothetical protein
VYPLVSAVSRVEMAGENMAAWWNATISAGVHDVPMVGIADPMTSAVAAGNSSMFNAHNPCAVAWQWMVSPPGHVIMHVFF